MLHLSIARSEAELDRLRSRWEGLCRHRGTIFQSFTWNQAACSFFSKRESPYVVLAESDSGAALIPAALSSSGIVFLGETLFDYRDVLALGDPGVLHRAWQELRALHLPLSVIALRAPLPDHWHSFTPVPFCGAPAVLRSDISAEAFQAAHPKLGRFMRRLRRQGAALRRYDGHAVSLLRWIYQQKARQFSASPINLFADQCRVDFLLAIACLSGSQCEVFTYTHDSQVIAALVTFRDGPVRRFYTTYFDQRWAKDSPGQVLLYEATILSLRDGLDCDYMTGEQPHKTRLATRVVPLYRIELTATALAQSLDCDSVAPIAV